MVRNRTAALVNFCRGSPSPPFDCASPALEVLPRLLEARDLEVLAEACHALSHLSEKGSEEWVAAMIRAGV